MFFFFNHKFCFTAEAFIFPIRYFLATKQAGPGRPVHSHEHCWEHNRHNNQNASYVPVETQKDDIRWIDWNILKDQNLGIYQVAHVLPDPAIYTGIMAASGRIDPFDDLKGSLHILLIVFAGRI